MSPKRAFYRFTALLTVLAMLAGFFPAPRARAATPLSPLPNPQTPNYLIPTDPLPHPLTLSRVQSAYVAGTETITLTVANNLPATRIPQISDTATLTDTLEILASFVITDDVNTLRELTVVDTLAAGTTLLAASGNPAQNGSTLTWALPDLPPQASATITLSVQTPAQGADFVALDTGAQASAELWGEAVTAATLPAALIPAGIDPAYTLPTVDADARDADMLWKAAELGQDALAMFAYVRGLDYEAYAGSLRGTRGALWGEGGNSADKSSLLIAMLRAAGFPARYRHGALSTANAQTLIGAMFPSPAGVAGYLPVDAPLADPLNDAGLLALVADHWWVEAYLPGVGWQDLDPSFAAAQPGDVFAVPGANDRSAALPAETRQTVTFELEVEQYSFFPVNGAFLSTSTPLTATFAAPELAAKAVTFGHFVHTEVQGGVYANIIHTYTPFFAIGGDDFLYTGNEFQDLLTNFPFASHFTTAEWLHVTIADADGNVTDSFTRELKDLIGLSVRQNGGNPNIALPEDNAPFAGVNDLFASWFLPNAVANRQFARRLQTENLRAIIAAALAADNLPEDLTTPQGIAAFQQMNLQFVLTRNDQYALAGLEFAKAADAANQKIEQNLFVNLVYEQPRIIIASSQGQADGTVQQAVDLRSTRARILAAPGQAQQAAFTAQWLKGVAESYFEGDAVFRLTGQPPVTIARIFDEMAAQGIEPARLAPGDIEQLPLYFAEPSRYAYAEQALLEGKTILIPEAPVTVDGEPVLGWWEIDPQTGEVNSVLENGLHVSLVEWEMISILVDSIFLANDVREIHDAVAGLWNCVAAAVVPALQGNPGGPVNCLQDWSPPGRAPQTTAWRYLPAYLCPVDACGVEQFALAYPEHAPIPLPELLVGYDDGLAGEDWAGRTIAVSDGGGGGAPTFDLSALPASGSALPGATHSFQLSAAANFDGLVDAWVFAPEGWIVSFDPATLDAQLTPPLGALPGEYALRVVGQARDYPQVFVSLPYTITVPDSGSLALDWQPEANISAPTGDAFFPAVSGETNDGESEIPNAAFRLDIANYSAQDKTLNLSVSGAPAGWLVLNGARQETAAIALAANEQTQVGLYVSPPALPAPGVSFDMNVQLADGLGNVENAVIPWAMPALAFNFLEISPAEIFIGSSSSAEFTLSLTNVGNASGEFSFAASLPPITATIANLPASLALAVGETQTFTAALVADGLPAGIRFPIVVGSQAPGSYTQYALAEAQVITPLTEPVFLAAGRAAESCTAGEPSLSSALDALAQAMLRLENSCQSAGCSLTLRDQTVNAAQTVALYAGGVASGLAQDDALNAIAAQMAAHTSDDDLLADLQALSEAVVALDSEVCAWSQHMPALQWTPYYGAALVSETITYTLDLTNRGSLTTTYSVTVNSGQWIVDSEPWTVNPGETVRFEVPASGGAIGLYDLDASAVFVDDDAIAASAAAKLNVVDKFVQITAVIPDPAFVETGVSSTTVSVEIANIANVPQPATARTTITAPGGATTFSAETALNLLVGAPRVYELQTVDTSGWSGGVYTVSVELLRPEGDPLPAGEGYAFLGVGQSVGVSHAVYPPIVPPGVFTVTTVITSEILAQAIVSEQWTVDSDQYSVISNQYPVISDPQIPDPQLPDPQSPTSQFQILNSQFPISRTQDTGPAIVYTGAWATVNNIFASHMSDGSYTASATPGDSAAFAFSGTWVHIGFSKARNGGMAEVIIDGVSQGMVDLYYPVQQCFESQCASSAAFGGLSDAPHTLEIVVSGQAHPNANGAEVKIDYIDTWDGTLYPDGISEQNDARVWVQAGAWVQVTEAAASGGSYMNDGSIGNSQSAWLPFTGDSASFVALARYDSHRVHVWVDGVLQGDVLIYSGEAMTRTYSFSGFGAGPHVMQIGTFRGEANVDAFITPAVGPDYDPPVYTGLVRYEEDHPALRYNGYDFAHRPSSWAAANAAQVSEYAYAESNTAGDVVSFDFYGSWLEISLRTRNRGGLADVSIDGVSVGAINAYSASENIAVYQFDVITGTHTVTITVLGISNPPNIYNQVYLDYVEYWDGSPVSDDFQNARRGEESARVRVSSSISDAAHPNAIQGDFVNSGLPNSNSNVWYSFIGDSVTVYGLTVADNANAEIYIDGVLTDTISFDYPFSVQPFAFHYSGLGPGAHSIRVHNVWEMRIDGFASNQPPLPYQPVAEWWDNTPAGNGAPFFGTYGVAAGMAAGDVNGDGLTEIVVTADDVINFGTMFVYRGDGADTGDGDPILWAHDFGGGVFRTWVSSPAIAELDGQPGAEIVVAAGNELYAFHGDGSIYWVTDTVNIFETLTAPAIANLDLDPEPEIVANLGNRLEVRAHDGELLWSATYPAEVNPPVLADLSGDGLLDIVLTGWDDDVLVYDFNYGSPQLTWSTVLSSTMAGTFGAPAVADVDGLQPGGDPGPEVILASNGLLTVLNGEDGALVWATPLDPGNPGGVSVADLDGDGEIEIVTGMKHEFETGRFGMIYALNADGSLLWSAIAEDSTSANNAAVMDLDGDGRYEVAWNGKEQGFTIFDGLTGNVLFNEPLVLSYTGTDYPLIVDADNDGLAEVVVAALQGVRVFGNGNVWGPARPLWNQHSYHITNVNDDLSLPFSETDSWQAHNTYRTQTHLVSPMPSYAIAVTHTVGLDSLTVLTQTFNITPSAANPPDFTWDFRVDLASPLVTQTFATRLDNLQPGETRLVAQGTTAEYVVPGGRNRLALPPLYVSAARILAVEPPTRTLGSGASAVFTATLTNPTDGAALLTLAVAGFPTGWASLPEQVSIPAHGSAAVLLQVAIPFDAQPAQYPFIVSAAADSGMADQAGGVLTVAGPQVQLAIAPLAQTVNTGAPAAYTLTITNLESVERTYDLAASGLAALDLPAQATVAAGGSLALAFDAIPQNEGGNPFTIEARATGGGAAAAVTASVTGKGFHLVQVSLSPESVAGPGVAVPIAVTVTNLGSAPETFDLSGALPAGWQGALTFLSQPVSALLVLPGEANAATLQWLVTPAASAAPGGYEVTVTAQSPLAAGSGAGLVQVTSLGVAVEVLSGPVSLLPGESGEWQLQVTNLGAAADSFALAAFGAFAPEAQFIPASVSLSPGASAMVEMSITIPTLALPRDHFIGVLAQSQSLAAIRDEAATSVEVGELQAVAAAWLPAEQSVNAVQPVYFTLAISNTGNGFTAFDVTVSVDNGATASAPLDVVFLPARGAGELLVAVVPPANGVYTLTAVIHGGAAQTSVSATLRVGWSGTPIYLPLILNAAGAGR